MKMLTKLLLTNSILTNLAVHMCFRMRTKYHFHLFSNFFAKRYPYRFVVSIFVYNKYFMEFFSQRPIIKPSIFRPLEKYIALLPNLAYLKVHTTLIGKQGMNIKTTGQRRPICTIFSPAGNRCVGWQ